MATGPQRSRDAADHASQMIRSTSVSFLGWAPVLFPALVFLSMEARVVPEASYQASSPHLESVSAWGRSLSNRDRMIPASVAA